MSLFKRVAAQVDKYTQPSNKAYSGRLIKHYAHLKMRFAMVGTVGAGKTTECAKMLVTAHTRSEDDPNFFCRLVEHKSNLRVSASNLRKGVFPPKTLPMGKTTQEAGLQIIRKSMFGEKRLHIPVMDVAGEDIQYMLEDYDDNEPDDTPNWHRIKELLEYLKNSQGFIFVLPAPRAFIGREQLEQEPEDLAADPDVNVSRLLEQILNYKQLHHGNAIRAIAIIISKYDLCQDYCIKNEMDLYTESGMRQFMKVYFPDTNMQLKFLQQKGLVRFFPSHVDLKRDQNRTPLLWNAPGQAHNGSPVIEVDPRTRRPKYSENASMALFDYLEQFAS